MRRYYQRLLMLYKSLSSIEDVAERWRIAAAAAQRWKSS